MAEEQISVVLKANIDNYNKNMSIAAGVLKDLQKQSAAFMKINTGVEDSFTKIDFAAKKFGETAGVLEKKLVVVKKAMTDLVVAGQENTRAFKDLDNQYKIITNRLQNKAMAEAQAYAQSNMTNMALPKTAKGLDQASVSLKKNNMQMTNLALVLQDLPYGFRGIQNNLPALIGGMAGMTGGIYLAASAVIAFFTAWDNGMFGSTKSTNEWRKSLKETNDEIRNTLNYTNSEVSNLQGLVDVMLDVNSTESVRKKALLELRESIAKVDEAESKKMVNEGTAIGIVYKYIEAIKQKQMQEVVGKRIAEIELSQIEKRNKLAIDTAKANKGIHPIDFFMGNTELDNLNSEIIANETLLRQLEDLRKGATKALILNPFSDYNAKGGKGNKGAKPKDNYLLDRLKSQQQAYKDDIYAFRNYGILIINEEEKIAVARAKADGTYEKNKKDIHARYQADRLTNDNLFESNLNKILDENAKKRTAIEDKEFKIQAANRKMIADGILAINKQFAEDDLKNAILFAKNQTKIIETELGVQDKLNRNNLTNRIQFTEEALAKLVALAAYTFDPKVLAVYLDAIDKINAKLKGMGETWDTTANQIKGILEGVMADSITKFAENIGTALAGGKVDLFGGIGEMIAEGAIAIGKALIAYGVALKAFEMAKLDPVLAIVAGAGLVIAGTVLKAKLAPKEKGGAMPFANGGIVSGPTMGLVGEYPGAKTNPEVIAPLDKLKDMIGGGGNGEFVLRGNDLVLALQRSNSSLNLRRGGI